MDDARTDPRPTKRAQPFDVDLGARLRTVRNAARMSQTAMGEAVGVSFQQIQKYETGKDRISASTLFRIATALSVPVSSLFERVSQPESVRQPKPSGVSGLSVKIVTLLRQIEDPDLRKRFVSLATVLAESLRDTKQLSKD